jgi:flavin reductase (DIM6/NTAB) family NADH-FMN oxidoreductase RutF
MDGSSIKTKLVKAHRVALECTLVDAVEVSDHCIYIAEVVEAHSNPDRPQLFAMDGYAVLDTI